MKLTILFFSFTSLLLAQSKKIVISDFNDKFPIANVSIDFMNGYGIYSSENGYVKYDLLPEKFLVSHLSYKDSIFNKREIKDTLFLKSKNLILKEVFVTKEKSNLRLKEKIVKVKNHGDFSKTIFPSSGLELCFYIPNTQNKNSFLHSVSIPYINKSFELKEGKQKLVYQDFKDLIAINIYSSKDNKPFECLSSYSFNKIIYYKSNEDSFTIDFSNKILLPSEGIFVGVKFIGRVDENDDLIIELPYKLIEYKVEIIKISQNLMPLIPLIEVDNVTSYLRYEFSGLEDWLPITDYNFKIKNLDAKSKKLGVAIGFKLFTD